MESFPDGERGSAPFDPLAGDGGRGTGVLHRTTAPGNICGGIQRGARRRKSRRLPRRRKSHGLRIRSYRKDRECLRAFDCSTSSRQSLRFAGSCAAPVPRPPEGGSNGGNRRAVSPLAGRGGSRGDHSEGPPLCAFGDFPRTGKVTPPARGPARWRGSSGNPQGKKRPAGEAAPRRAAPAGAETLFRSLSLSHRSRDPPTRSVAMGRSAKLGVWRKNAPHPGQLCSVFSQDRRFRRP